MPVFAAIMDECSIGPVFATYAHAQRRGIKSCAFALTTAGNDMFMIRWGDWAYFLYIFAWAICFHFWPANDFPFIAEPNCITSVLYNL